MSTLEFPVRFEHPSYSLLGVILGVAVVALSYLSLRRLRIAQKHLELVEWRRLRGIVRALNITTKAGVVLSLSFLLANPYFETTITVPVEKASDDQLAQYPITVMLLMDVSLSMNSSDLKPTRLAAAQTMAKILANELDPKDLVGFISFAGQIYDTVLPTTIRTEVTNTIDNQTLRQSTAIGTVLDAAIGALQTYQFGGKAIVLFSDGKNNLGIDVSSAVNEAATVKIPIFTVSFGTYSIGEADPLALREASSKTGGKFFEARNEEMANVATAVSEISHEVKVGALKSVYDELIIPARDYQAPTITFSALLLAALLLAWFTGV